MDKPVSSAADLPDGFTEPPVWTLPKHGELAEALAAYAAKRAVP